MPFLRRSSSSPDSRASRILSRLPHRLQKYTTGLRRAPLSHVVAFLILHEITAILPLVGLFGLFHYTEYAPVGYVTDHWAGYVRDGVAKYERYFRRKRWFGFGEDDDGVTIRRELDRVGAAKHTAEHVANYEGSRLKYHSHARYEVETKASVKGTKELVNEFGQLDGKYRVLMDVALAWAITKAILPVRILASVWATPWFAGVLVRFRGMFRR